MPSIKSCLILDDVDDVVEALHLFYCIVILLLLCLLVFPQKENTSIICNLICRYHKCIWTRCVLRVFHIWVHLMEKDFYYDNAPKRIIHCAVKVTSLFLTRFEACCTIRWVWIVGCYIMCFYWRVGCLKRPLRYEYDKLSVTSRGQKRLQNCLCGVRGRIRLTSDARLVLRA